MSDAEPTGEEVLTGIATALLYEEQPSDGMGYGYRGHAFAPDPEYSPAWRVVDPDGVLVDIVVPSRFLCLSEVEGYIDWVTSDQPEREVDGRPPEGPDGRGFA